MLPPSDATAHESRPLQHSHVLAGSGKGHPQRRSELAEVALPTGELPDDRPSSGVSQGVEDAVQLW